MLRPYNKTINVSSLLTAIVMFSVIHGVSAEEGVMQRPYIDPTSYLRQEDLVSQRKRFELEPLGINAGGFKVFPKFDFNSEYSTNIFREDKASEGDGPEDDYIAHLQPGVWVTSDWNRHAVNLYVDSDIGVYADETDQHYEDLNLTLSGRLDVFTDSSINAGFHFDKEHEDRGSPEQTFGKIPTFYNRFAGDLFFNNKFNRLSIDIGAGVSYYRYEDTPAFPDINANLQFPPGSGVIPGITNGIVTNQDRNRWMFQPSLRFGYEIKPEYELFTKLEYIGVEYDEKFDDTRSDGNPDRGLQRSSDGYEGLVGLSFDLTELVYGEIAAGYMFRDYDDPLLEDFDGVKGYLNLTWAPTRLTSIHGTFTRSIAETTQIGVSGIVSNDINLTIDHELRRNVLLRLAGGYKFNDFISAGSNQTVNRQEDVYYANFRAKYSFSRYLSADLSYTYQERDVNLLLNDFDVHQIMLNFEGHL